jgi:hypothetical protein
MILAVSCAVSGLSKRIAISQSGVRSKCTVSLRAMFRGELGETPTPTIQLIYAELREPTSGLEPLT